MHVFQNVFTIIIETNEVLKYLNITNADMDSQWARDYTALQKTFGDILRAIATRIFETEIGKSRDEISKITQLRLNILLTVALLLGFSNLIFYFKFKISEEERYKKSALVILKMFKTLPPHIVFKNASVEYLLNEIFEKY